MFAMLLMNDYPVLVTATVIIAAFLAKIIHKTFKSRRAIGKLVGKRIFSV
jgi:tetrahydromethanopterin S-methyltransferase subunit E